MQELYNRLKSKGTRVNNINDNFDTGVAEEVYLLDFKRYTVIFENNKLKHIYENSTQIPPP